MIGNEIGKHIIPPPLTFIDCFINGKFITPRYVHCRRCLNDIEDDIKDNNNPQTRKRKCDMNNTDSFWKKER